MFKRYVPAAAGIVYAATILHSAPIASAEGDRVTPVREASTQSSWKEPYCGGRLLSAGRQVGESPSRRERAGIRAVRRHPVAELGDGPVQVFRVGETFFEPPGSTHLISENASDTEPASLLAVFVADNGAVLTTPVETH
jgi:hypothetical protein